MNVDPQVITALTATAALTGAGGLRFLDWIRRSRADNTETTITRLTAAVDRESARADAAETAEDDRRRERDTARARLHLALEYIAFLRGQLHRAGVTPEPYPSSLDPGRE